MNQTITSNADRDALLRFLDLMGDIGDLVNKYNDLGIYVVAHALTSKANEALACTYLPQMAPVEAAASELDDSLRCIACDKHFAEGDAYYPDVSGGFLHAACCGPERESYVGADGEPLKPGEPIPEPSIWVADD